MRKQLAFCFLLCLAGCTPTERTGAAADSPAAGPTPVACTGIGCQNGLEIEFMRSAWPAGEYRIQVDVDGAMTSCTGTLPLNACDSGPSFACTGAPGVRLSESGCALPASGQGLAGMSLETTSASRVTLTIEHAGALIGTTTLQPEFRQVRPNGPDCPPVCTNAGMRLKLR
jgi:hypothetical protein